MPVELPFFPPTELCPLTARWMFRSAFSYISLAKAEAFHEKTATLFFLFRLSTFAQLFLEEAAPPVSEPAVKMFQTPFLRSLNPEYSVFISPSVP